MCRYQKEVETAEEKKQEINEQPINKSNDGVIDDGNVDASVSACEKGGKEKLQVVLDKIYEYCMKDGETSKHEDIRQITYELKHNDDTKLVGKVLSGGLTNYSYKIYLQKNNKSSSSSGADTDTDDNDELCLFAKIGFSYA